MTLKQCPRPYLAKLRSCGLLCCALDLLCVFLGKSLLRLLLAACCTFLFPGLSHGHSGVAKRYHGG